MTRILTFLSHADNDKIIAEKIAKELEKYHFDVFLAHRDIEPGSEWEYILKNRIEECELFIVLLSSNFRNADYTNQEVGIAVCLKKKIFPLSIDNTMPYGFMSKYQRHKFDIDDVNEELVRFSELFRRVVNDTYRQIDELILALKHSDYFRESNKIGRELSSFSDFTEKHLRDLLDVYNSNSQVSDSWTAGPFIRNLLKIKKNHDRL